MKFVVLICGILALSACKTTVEADKARWHGDGYRVEVDGDDHSHKNFCPPGQHMKGRC
jgi:hypothetical protein